ncbi:leucine-rich repeat-containing protein 45 isoform X2 [Thalassophryne amazonica]|uniref:leucine-rich repeat-containing protein 45 isoform X2 n=1 Tax=Thalassophryne amazonica TaxID=390379 RepID=UPI001470D0C2|nr:leucine-rich repeat-containing protein 45 isoform X2 [Thalassophryne amazonica]
MEGSRHRFLQLCKEAGVEPQESVAARLQESGTASGSSLDLSGQRLSEDTCSVLGKFFHGNSGHAEVSLSDCMLSEEGAKVLLAGLSANTSVKVLDLKGNNLRSSGAEMLGKLLARNKTLRRLVLEWNAVGVWDEAFSLFCDGLAVNSVLTHLDLRNNQISHRGTSELALAVKCNSTLEVLDLRWNNVGLLGARSLLEALQKNKSIVQLELTGNNIPSDTLRALEQTTERNADCQSTLKESRTRTRVLSKEIQILQEEKGRQFLSLMNTIDQQREDLGCSRRSASSQISQLQDALNQRKSTVNSLTAKLQMLEAALALSEQKNHNMDDLLVRLKVDSDGQRAEFSRIRKKEQEESALREEKLHEEVQSLTEANCQLRKKVEEVECRSKSQQEQIFELKQELTNSTAELRLRLAQAEDRVDVEKRRSKQALENMDGLRQKEVEHITRHLEEAERTLQERILKLEGQRLQLEEEVSRAKAVCAAERVQADEDVNRVRAQLRLEEQQRTVCLEEKLRSARSSLQEVQLHCSQQKQITAELQAKTSQQLAEMERLRRRIEELQQELSGKEQEKVAELSQVRVELQEQIGHLQAERTAQAGLKEKISALERQMKVLSNNHREALLDKDSEMSSLLEKLRLKEAEIQRMRADEAHRATYLQNAVLAYVQGSPLAHCSSPKK